MADLVGATVDFLNANMTAQFGSSPARPKVFADLAPAGTSTPYAVLHDTDEVYDNWDSLGNFFAAGHIQLNVYGVGKSQVRSIGLAAIRLLDAGCNDGTLAIDEGTLLEMRAQHAASTPIVEVPGGTGTAAGARVAAERTVVLLYRVQYPPTD